MFKRQATSELNDYNKHKHKLLLLTCFTATYPVALQVPTEMPQIWLDKLHAVSDEIRDVPVSVPRNGTENQVVYPDGMNPYGAEICAFPNCFGPNDITGAPDATWLVSTMRR
jgi:hypothetical protein